MIAGMLYHAKQSHASHQSISQQLTSQSVCLSLSLFRSHTQWAIALPDHFLNHHPFVLCKSFKLDTFKISTKQLYHSLSGLQLRNGFQLTEQFSHSRCIRDNLKATPHATRIFYAPTIALIYMTITAQFCHVRLLAMGNIARTRLSKDILSSVLYTLPPPPTAWFKNKFYQLF